MTEEEFDNYQLCLQVNLFWWIIVHGHFVLSPGFARIQKPRWRPLELNDRSQRLHGKIGDCEQSRKAYFLRVFIEIFAVFDDSINAYLELMFVSESPNSFS